MKKIIYTPEWIEKILTGEKTMFIIPTQLQLGIHNVVNNSELEKIACQIEVVKVEKWDTDYWLDRILTNPNDVSLQDGRLFYVFGKTDGFTYNKDHFEDCRGERDYYYNYDVFPCWVRCSGFASIADFIQYHRDNYAPVKFAHTFNLMKGYNHVS